MYTVENDIVIGFVLTLIVMFVVAVFILKYNKNEIGQKINIKRIFGFILLVPSTILLLSFFVFPVLPGMCLLLLDMYIHN